MGDQFPLNGADLFQVEVIPPCQQRLAGTQHRRRDMQAQFVDRSCARSAPV
ncbi:hypothetical protein [Cryobacterium sp. TMT1-66-1]|uniref:hypothetical protein n=1 Tax=Cryobacterium sp. TMT1-66-1 TaxID=1259242 RepID=UPI00141AC27A|nr:hypothetical protein [Cryobacterium sp. TMT1-66-1]